VEEASERNGMQEKGIEEKGQGGRPADSTWTQLVGPGAGGVASDTDGYT
jgi:hypothetical protein